MRTESLLCIAIPRVSALFFTFQGNRLSCTTELYQPQCQSAPHWPPKCNGYGFLVCVLSYRTIRFDSGESMCTRNSLRGIYFLIFYLVQNRRIASVFQCFSNHVKGRYNFSAKMHGYLYKIETGSLDPGCASLMHLSTQFYF